MYYDDQARRFNFASGLLLGVSLGAGAALLIRAARPRRPAPAPRRAARALRRGGSELRTALAEAATAARTHLNHLAR